MAHHMTPGPSLRSRRGQALRLTWKHKRKRKRERERERERESWFDGQSRSKSTPHTRRRMCMYDAPRASIRHFSRSVAEFIFDINPSPPFWFHGARTPSRYPAFSRLILGRVACRAALAHVHEKCPGTSGIHVHAYVCMYTVHTCIYSST